MATKIYLQENIKYLRDLHRYTYPEMAKIAGCTIASMKSYELRGTTPPLEVIIKLADKFGVTMDQLVRGKLASTKQNSNFVDIYQKRLIEVRVELENVIKKMKV